MKSKPDVLIGIALMFKLEVTSRFLLLYGLLNSPLSSLEVYRRAGVCHILVVVLWEQLHIMFQGEIIFENIRMHLGGRLASLPILYHRVEPIVL